MFCQSLKYCNVTIKISYLQMYFDIDNMRGYYMETLILIKDPYQQRYIEMSISIPIPYKSFFFHYISAVPNQNYPNT